jgi:hypothetical protein
MVSPPVSLQHNSYYSRVLGQLPIAACHDMAMSSRYPIYWLIIQLLSEAITGNSLDNSLFKHILEWEKVGNAVQTRRAYTYTHTGLEVQINCDVCFIVILSKCPKETK